MKHLRVIFATFFLVLVISHFHQTYSQTEWTKYNNGDPVLLPGSAGEWDDSGIVGPSVIFDGTTYKMWYGAWNGTTFRIGYAYSTDGISWTKYDDPLTTNPPYAESDPVLNLGPGTFESVWVYFPQVYFDGTIYHMWYAGTDGNHDRVGYATSSDGGITWEKDIVHNPVINLGSSGSWDDAAVVPGPVLFNGTTYEMIYNGYDGFIFQGGYATSPDGFTWTKDNIIFPVGSSTSWDYPRTNPGTVVYNSNTSLYYSFYSGGSFGNWQIGYATATAFNGPWTKDPSILLDSSYVSFPTVIYDPGDDLYKMWYSGNGIEYATSPVIVPVELTSFTATVNGKEIILNWSTATEINNMGFEIQRSTEGKEFFTVGFISGHGTTTEQQNYKYADKNFENGKYYYRLKQVDYDGSYEYSDVVEAEFRAFSSYLLEQNYPNPFNPTTSIGFALQNKSNVQIKILNVIGEEVAVILNEEKEPGYYLVEFNATNLPSGVYFYKLKAGSFVETKKMLLLK